MVHLKMKYLQGTLLYVGLIGLLYMGNSVLDQNTYNSDIKGLQGKSGGGSNL